MQQKTQRPVQFEITEQTRDTVTAWLTQAKLKADEFLFPSRLHTSPHISTRQYGRLVEKWVTSIGLDPSGYGTHSMRRTKATLIYRRTKNLRAVQFLSGHTKLEGTVRYPGIEVDDAWRSPSKQRCSWLVSFGRLPVVRGRPLRLNLINPSMQSRHTKSITRQQRH